MATLIRANHNDLISLAKALGLNLDPASTKKMVVSLLQGEMTKRMDVPVTGQDSTPLEDFTPVLPIMGDSGDAPPPSDNSGDKGDGEGSDEDELADDPENEPMEPSDDAEFLIHVYIEPQRRVSVHVRSNDTIAILKVHLQHMVGINRRDQRLHFIGGLRDLEDRRTLEYYNIEEGDVLEMTILGQEVANEVAMMPHPSTSLWLSSMVALNCSLPQLLSQSVWKGDAWTTNIARGTS